MAITVMSDFAVFDFAVKPRVDEFDVVHYNLYFYNKIKYIESNISKIVRKLAIDDAIVNLNTGSNEESDKKIRKSKMHSD